MLYMNKLVRCSDDLFNYFTSTVGVKQGGPLSPTLKGGNEEYLRGGTQLNILLFTSDI